MPIDLRKERIIPLRDYPNHLPIRKGKRLNRSAGYRHAIAGVRGVKLEIIQLPSGRYTSIEAIQRFVDLLTGQALPPAPPKQQRHKQSRRRQHGVEREIEQIRALIRAGSGRVSVPTTPARPRTSPAAPTRGLPS